VETPTHINGATLDVHYPDPTGSDTFVVSSSIYRLERPIHRSACAPLPSSPWTFQSIADRLSPGPLPLDLLSHAGWPEGLRFTFPREEDRDPRSPRCLPSMKSISEEAVDHAQRTRQSSQLLQRVDLYPQIVPKLWTRVRAFFAPQRAPL